MSVMVRGETPLPACFLEDHVPCANLACEPTRSDGWEIEVCACLPSLFLASITTPGMSPSATALSIISLKLAILVQAVVNVPFMDYMLLLIPHQRSTAPSGLRPAAASPL